MGMKKNKTGQLGKGGEIAKTRDERESCFPQASERGIRQ